MSFTEFEIARMEAAMENFLSKRRPPEHLHDKVDLSWRIEKQSVILFLIRPNWRDPSQKMEEPIAKTTYISKTKLWKIYWMRSDLKWHVYPHLPEVLHFEEFVAEVDEDRMNAFWG